MKNIGGQALIEGIMMKSSKYKSISIRKSSGEIITNVKNIDENPIKNILFLRGVSAIITSLIEGSEDLNYALSFYENDEDIKKGRFEVFIENCFKADIERVLTAVSFAISIFLAVFMFLFLPASIAKIFEKNSGFLFSLIEGIIKIIIFISYLLVVSLIPDIKRVFMYHGAEHKSIFAYERKLDLTIENVKKMPRFHPRCGTNFITVTLIISIIINSFIQVDHIILRVFVKLIVLPIVVGTSYEIIKISGKRENIFTNMFIFPGMIIQKITTKEPDEKQIEVAIEALKKVI